MAKSAVVRKQNGGAEVVRNAAIELELPVAEVPEGYTQRMVKFRLTPGQAVGFARLRLGLAHQECALENGRKVASLEDAVRWVGERLQQSG
jgi:hypothetical protein